MCNHPNLQSTARVDFCPDGKYEFRYGDAHTKGPDSQTKLANRGEDTGDYGIHDPDTADKTHKT